MTRTFGKKAGALTLLGDFLKTALALFACRMIFGTEGVFIGGIFCILGHAFPVFFKFKGGKGVACFAILVLITSITMNMWYLFVILFVFFAFIVVVSSDAGVALIYVFIFITMAFVGGVNVIWFLSGLLE